MSTNLDYTQVIQNCYNETENRLMVDADITAVIPGGIQVNINAADDSIQIGNSTGNFASVDSSGNLSVNANLNGLSSFQTSQYTVGITAVQLAPVPLSSRSSLAIKVITTSTTDKVYIGNSNSVTTSNGFFLFNGDSVQLDIKSTQSIWAIGTSAGQIVSIIEIG